MFVIRFKREKEEQVFTQVNRVEKAIAEQGFEVKRMSKDDIKRFLAIYFGASMQGELIPDIDGKDCFDEESWKSKMLDIAIIVSVIVFAVCFAILLNWHIESRNSENAINELNQVLTTETEGEETQSKKTQYIRYCVAWLEIPGTDIDYPVMQKPGNPNIISGETIKVSIHIQEHRS